MEIIETNGINKDFKFLCTQLELFQYKLLPNLKNKEYNLTDDLEEISEFILYDNSKPIGCIGLKKIDSKSCEIVRVFVLDQYRGNGYASLLLKRIEDKAKSLGFTQVEMVAWCKATAALKLYEKFGFIKSEEKISEYFGYKYIELTKNLI